MQTGKGLITGLLPAMNGSNDQNVDCPNDSGTKGADLATANSPALVAARGNQAVGATFVYSFLHIYSI